VIVFSSAVFLGFLHGLGADHLVAIAALASADARSARTRAVAVAVRFAVGHALLLGAGAAAAILAGWTIPLVVERGGEITAGLLLVGLGALGLWAVKTGRVYSHAHSRPPRPIKAWHLHLGLPAHHPLPSSHNSAIPTLVGAAFAVSSLRALTLLAPLGKDAAAASLPLLFTLIGLFAVGILLSMSLFGVALARVLSTRAVVRLGSFGGTAVAVGSIALGVYWIISAL
jgi:nickel/cobalt transporter (NicO) family protein